MHFAKQKTAAREMLEKYDKDKNGQFDVDEVTQIVEDLIETEKQSKRKSKINLYLSIGIILLCGVVLAGSILANYLSKETTVENGALVSKNDHSQIVATSDLKVRRQYQELLEMTADKAIRKLSYLELFAIPIFKEIIATENINGVNHNFMNITGEVDDIKFLKVVEFSVQINHEDNTLNSFKLVSSNYILHVESDTMMYQDLQSGDDSWNVLIATNDQRRRLQFTDDQLSVYSLALFCWTLGENWVHYYPCVLMYLLAMAGG